MNVVRNISEIEDFDAIANDFSVLLGDASNTDIVLEFPATVTRYSGDVGEVTRNLVDTKANCQTGVRQQFVAFSGARAVGMSVVRLIDNVPDGVDTTWPNVSGFVCNPYRHQGIGSLSLLTRMSVVDRQFNGNAWTQVKKANVYSHRMVTNAGFLVISENSEHVIYAYRSVRV
jgi:hypothetical protein